MTERDEALENGEEEGLLVPEPGIARTAAATDRAAGSVSESLEEVYLDIVRRNPALLPWVVTGFHNLVLGYATMAPLTRELLGIDPFASEAVARQTEFLTELQDMLFRP